MNLKGSKKKKYLILGTIGTGVLTVSIVTPIIILNNKDENEDKDINKIVEILKQKIAKEKTIELPSDSSGKIVANNKEKIIEKIKTLIGRVNLKGVKIEVSMQNDTNISIVAKKIIIKLIKNKVSKEVKDFSVKKKNVNDEDIAAIKKILDSKTGNDLIITLSSGSTGNIIGNNDNKNAIIKKLRKLIDSSNKDGDSNHPSLKGTSIEISMSLDAPISTIFQNINVSISKSGGTTLKTTKKFLVKRDFTISELANKDIESIKNILDSRTGEDLKIILPGDSTGNIVANNDNKNAIIKKLRELIDFSNTSGEANHPSLKGTTIEVSMNVDALISTTFQNIIVSIAKTSGTTIRTTNIFQVKRKFTNSELANKDIESIKNILDAKIGEDLKIILPSDSSGNIIDKLNNKNLIKEKLRKLIDPLNKNGEANHPSLLGAKIEVSMNVDAPISTIFQNIIVSISKTDGQAVRTIKTFQVKREFTTSELANNDVEFIKNILDAKTGEDLKIILSSDSSGNIVNKAQNKNAIKEKLRKLIDPLNTNGEANHPSLRGTMIEVSMNVDAPISTSFQNIIVSISKTNGQTIRTIKTFQVKREFTTVELASNDVESIKNILDAKTGEDLKIILPSDSSGNIIGKTSNKDEIIKKLRKLIDPLNKNGESNHPSLLGTKIEVSMNVDAPISTTFQNIVVSISKTDGQAVRTIKTFQVKREFTTGELANNDVEFIKNILDAKSGEDLKIILSSDSTGNIIAKPQNKNAIKEKLRKLIDPLNTNGEANHPSLRGATIEVSMNVDAPISTIFQNIIVSISKTNGQTVRTIKTFQVKREFIADEDILAIKKVLDAKTGEDLKIILASDSSGNIINKPQNKNAIKEKIRKLIDPLNKNGEANHPSLRGTTIEVSMNVDAPISTSFQDIIVSISKTNGQTVRTIKTFQVKREFTADEDILAIKKVLDAKTGEDLKIILPSDSSGNIIDKLNNKNLIKEKLRKLIDPLNKNGEANHPSLRGTTIEVSMNVDVPISTTFQNIIVSISKFNRNYIITNIFKVKREFTTIELINKDIETIKNILDAKTGEDLKIILSSDSTGNIIAKPQNKNAIKEKIRKLIDPLNKNGEANHPSLRGATIEVSMNVDAPISTSFQNIIVSISKTDGQTVRTIKTFQVKREFTADEDILAIKNILDAKSGEDLKIILPSDSSGNIIAKPQNKNAINEKLIKLIDPLNNIGDTSHSSLRGTTIEVSMNVDAPISTAPQNIIVTISKSGGSSVTTSKTFQVNRYDRINEEISKIKTILDAKTGEDLKIILASDSTGNIIENVVNKNAIERKLRKLVDPSNTNGEANHESLLGTTIEVSMNVDAPISTIFQSIIVTINKIGGNSLNTSKTFQVKREFTIDEDILAIKNILDAKSGEDLKIILSSDSSGNIIENVVNKNAIERRLRELIDPLNINNNLNHPSLRGTTIEVSMDVDTTISTSFQNIIVKISKTDGTTLKIANTFQVKKDFTNAEKITNYFANEAKKTFTISGGEALNTKAKILVAIKKHLAIDNPDLWTNEIQSLISVDNDETISEIIKEDYDETSFSIVYNDDDDTIQNVELKIKHLRTKIENRIIINNLYDYYNKKWNTAKKALIVNLKNINRWNGPQIKKAVNDATKNIFLENKVNFNVNGFYSSPHIKWAYYVPNNTRTHFSSSLNTPTKFRVSFYSGKGQRAFSRSMNIFIKAIRK